MYRVFNLTPNSNHVELEELTSCHDSHSLRDFPVADSR